MLLEHERQDICRCLNLDLLSSGAAWARLSNCLDCSALNNYVQHNSDGLIGPHDRGQQRRFK
eukprot:3330390-Alexandrium_andersonii.AAC.1